MYLSVRPRCSRCLQFSRLCVVPFSPSTTSIQLFLDVGSRPRNCSNRVGSTRPMIQEIRGNRCPRLFDARIASSASELCHRPISEIAPIVRPCVCHRCFRFCVAKIPCSDVLDRCALVRSVDRFCDRGDLTFNSMKQVGFLICNCAGEFRC